MRHVPRPDGLKLTLYDVILNVNQVQETFESEAQVDGKLIVLTSGEEPLVHRYYYNDAYHFDFFADDTFEKQSGKGVNTRVRVFNEGNKTDFTDYYAYISKINFLRLSWKFDKTWIQQKDNLMWLTNVLLTVASVAIAALAIKISLTSPASQTLMLDKQQLRELSRELRDIKAPHLDTQAGRGTSQRSQPKALPHSSL
jgi:hypothetical protein